MKHLRRALIRAIARVDLHKGNHAQFVGIAFASHLIETQTPSIYHITEHIFAGQQVTLDPQPNGHYNLQRARP